MNIIFKLSDENLHSQCASWVIIFLKMSHENLKIMKYFLSWVMKIFIFNMHHENDHYEKKTFSDFFYLSVIKLSELDIFG